MQQETHQGERGNMQIFLLPEVLCPTQSRRNHTAKLFASKKTLHKNNSEHMQIKKKKRICHTFINTDAQTYEFITTQRCT